MSHNKHYYEIFFKRPMHTNRIYDNFLQKNGTAPSLKITADDSGKTLAVTKGQAFSLSLLEPSDGGYQSNSPEFDSSVLQLNSHTFTPPPDGNIGAEGVNVWTFTSLKSETTTLKVTANRGYTELITLFNGTIMVK